MPQMTPISEFELRLADRVACATFPVGHSHKRFIRGISAASKLSDRGRWYLAFIANRYRWQYKLSEEQWAWIRERLSGDIPGRQTERETEPSSATPDIGGPSLRNRKQTVIVQP